MGWTFARLLTSLVLASWCVLAPAQTYPNRPIRLIVPFPAGGTADFVARTVAQALSQSLGQPVVVDNRGGADGAIAGNAVIGSAPDGYTLFFATNTPMNAAPALRKVPPYDPMAAFTPISLVCKFGFFLIVHESVPVKTASEFLAYARANPGKLNYGTGNGASILTTAQLAAAEKLDVVHIPYKGDAPAAVDLIAGRIQFSIATLSPAVLPQIQSGHLRVFATLLPHRSPLLPDSPIADEAGLRGMTIQPWGGLFGPAGLPKEVVDRVNSEMRTVAMRRDVRDALDQVAVELQASSPEELSTWLRDQLGIWKRAVQELGIERN
ncbi:MAG: tripartite tricarboxylate transporter substrate binding protein [Rhizobacter sp.]|nr:tripartite tricarboxylate transporter substrate binding protein [Rhizobacter sp.]